MPKVVSVLRAQFARFRRPALRYSASLLAAFNLPRIAVGQARGVVQRELLANSGYHFRRSCNHGMGYGLCWSTVPGGDLAACSHGQPMTANDRPRGIVKHPR